MLTSYADLVGFLVQQKVPHYAEPSQSAVEIPTHIRGEEGRLVLFWDTRATLVHVVQPLNIAVTGEHVSELVDALVRINHTLMLPGFGFDHSRNSLYYRWVVPRHADGSFGEDEVDRAIKTVLTTCRDFLPALRAVAQGGAAAADVLTIAEAMRIEPVSG